MNDGTYAIRVSADGFVIDSTLVLDALHAKGGDARYSLRGQVSRAGAHVLGALTLELAAGLLKNTQIQNVFAVSMSGTGSETGFSLWGTGPLGLIVELTGRRVGD